MNKLFIKLLSQLSDAVVLFDIAGKVIFSNLEKSRFSDIVVDKQIVDASILSEAAEIHSSKTIHIKKIKSDMVELIDNDNHTVIFQNDNTFCFCIRNQLEKTKYMTLRDNMFELIDHELRAPMQDFKEGAFILSDMLKENNGEIKDTESFHTLIKFIINNVTEVTSKIERLLELSAAYGDDPIRNKERVDLLQVVNSAIDSLKEISSSKNIVVKLEQKGEIIGNIYGSFGWLKRAIEECVQNSIEHSNNGSEIHIKLRQNSHFAHIIVRDFGQGVLPKVKHTLFEPFIGGGDKDVLSTQGLGIGLSLAKKIIKDHGGNIKSVEIRGGVEFHIELPTGGVITSNNDLDIRQSQLYARDLALLIKKRYQK